MINNGGRDDSLPASRRAHARDQPARRPWAVELTASILCKRWKSAIISALASGECRFGELARVLPGISGKVLTERIRELESESIVVRSGVTDARRPAYRLTAIGHELAELVLRFEEWGTAYYRGAPSALARHGLVQLYDSSHRPLSPLRDDD